MSLLSAPSAAAVFTALLAIASAASSARSGAVFDAARTAGFRSTKK